MSDQRQAASLRRSSEYYEIQISWIISLRCLFSDVDCRAFEIVENIVREDGEEFILFVSKQVQRFFCPYFPFLFRGTG